MLIAVGLVVVAGLAFLAFRLFGSGSRTGAESPEAVVDQLIASAIGADTVGFAEVIHPDEVAAMGRVGKPIADAYTDLYDAMYPDTTQLEPGSEEMGDVLGPGWEYISESLDLAIAGADGSEDVEYEVIDLDDEGRFKRVRIQSLAITIEADRPTDDVVVVSNQGVGLSLHHDVVVGAGIHLVDTGEGLRVTAELPTTFDEPAETEFFDDVHADLVVIEEDGGWYLSIGYTIAELIRNTSGSDTAPDFGSALELIDSGRGGSATPEAVVTDLSEAVLGLDYVRIVGLLDPATVPYLHDYRPFIDEAIDHNELADARRDREGYEIEWVVTAEGDGGTADVVLQEIRYRDADGNFMDMDLTTWCGRIEAQGESINECLEDYWNREIEPSMDSGEVSVAFDPFAYIPDRYTVPVVEREGRWYLDPAKGVGQGVAGYIRLFAGMAEDGTFDELIDYFLDGSSAMTIQTERDRLGRIGVGPIVSVGPPRTVEPVDGFVSAGFDDGNGFGGSLGMVKVTADSEFAVGSQAFAAGESHWMTVSLGEAPPGVFPGAILQTEGPVEFEVIAPEERFLFERYEGTIGADGAELFWSVGRYKLAGDVSTAWADPFGSNMLDGSESDHDSGYVVVWGEPGTEFSLEPAYPVIDTQPVPISRTSLAELGLTDDSRVLDFATFAERRDFVYLDRLNGGYFDGCGPDDPDVESWRFQFAGAHGDFVIVTPYPSQDRAQAALDALALVRGSCELYSLDIDAVVSEPDHGEVWVYYSTGPGQSFLETYSLRGDTIVVAAGPLEVAQVNHSILSGYDG